MPGPEPHLLAVDLTSAGVPHVRYAELRRREPVCWREAPEAGGYWALLKHAAVRSGELNAWQRGPVRLSERRP